MMQAFKDLRIIDPDGDRSNLLSFLGTLRSANNQNWLFLNKESNEYATHIFKDSNEVAVFRSPEICSRIATIWLILSGREVKISNIVPSQVGRLSFEEYNAIFDRFFDEMVKPAARAAKVDVVTTGSEVHLEEVVGRETYEKLAIWEATANKSSGNSHELDFERWADFLTTAFTCQSKIDVTLLERWLLEDRGWTDIEAVQRLGSEFEYGMDLLNFYVNNR